MSKETRNTKFDTNVSNKMLLNAAKCQGYSIYRFGVIKGKPTGKFPPRPAQITAKNYIIQQFLCLTLELTPYCYCKDNV